MFIKSRGFIKSRIVFIESRIVTQLVGSKKQGRGRPKNTRKRNPPQKNKTTEENNNCRDETEYDSIRRESEENVLLRSSTFNEMENEIERLRYSMFRKYFISTLKYFK